jgi:trimeric autotransporter adhesin
VMADLEQAIESRSLSAAGVAMSAVDGLVDRLARARDAAAESSGEMARGYASVASRVAAAGPIVPQVDTSAIDAAARQIKPIRPDVDTSAVAAAAASVDGLAAQVRGVGAAAGQASGQMAAGLNSAVGAAKQAAGSVRDVGQSALLAADGVKRIGAGFGAGDVFSAASTTASVDQLIATLQEAKAAIQDSAGAMSAEYSAAAERVVASTHSMFEAVDAGVIPEKFRESASEARRTILGIQAWDSQGIKVSGTTDSIDRLIDRLTQAKEPAAQTAGAMVRDFESAARQISTIPIFPIVDTSAVTTATAGIESLADQIRNMGATAVETSAEISSGFNATAGSVATASGSVGYLIDDLESARATASLLAGGVTSSVAGVIRASRALESARMTGDPAAIAAASSSLDEMNARLRQSRAAAAEASDAISNGFKLAADEVEKSTTKVATWADHLKSLQSEATGINKQFRTPEQKYADEMLALKEMIKEGMIFGDAARRAGANYREELAKALGIQKETTREQSKPLAGVGAVQSGTSAAYSAIQSSAREWTQQTKTQTAQLKAQEAANKKLDAIVANTRDKLKLDTVSL